MFFERGGRQEKAAAPLRLPRGDSRSLPPRPGGKLLAGDDLIRLSAKLQAISPKSTFPIGEGYGEGYGEGFGKFLYRCFPLKSGGFAGTF